MLKARLFFIFCFTVSLLYAQQNKLSIETNSSAYSGWETYFSYNSIPSIAEGVNEIYFASYNSIFSYNIFNSQIEKFDTLNELSGDEISAFYHSENNNLIAIGYSRGFLQIINLNSNSIINIYDILNKPTIPADRKKINHFYQNGEVLLISTGYGISVYDVTTFEFGDTYYIGDFASMLNISSTIVDENYIYASSPDLGIFRANLESNLIDFNSWQVIYTGNIYELLINENNILFYDDFNLMSIKNEEIITLSTLENEIKNVSINDSKIIIISEDNCIIYNNDLSQILNLFESETYMTIFNDGIIKNNKTYIATDEKGVLVIENSNNGFSFLKPDGPLENNIFSVETLNSHTWVSFGSYSEYFNPYPLKYSGVSSYDENLESWFNITKDSIPNQAVNLNNISINPFDNNNVFISSFHGGLIEMDNFNFTELYDNNNSGLETLLTSDSEYESIRISDIEFDENGDLWVLNSRVDNPLKSFSLDNNSWNSYDFTEIINDGFQDELGFNDIEIDDYGNKWIASLRSGLIGFNNDSGNIRLRKVFSQDQSDMTSSYVKSIEQQYITDIEVDGANYKWVGTIGSGVFYFSPNGQQTIYHFTKENSPLPSNNINDISVNSVNGKVYFATDRGLVSFNTGSSSSSENFSSAFVYPNPVRPEFNTQLDKIKIKGLTENVNIKITDIAGNLVAEAQSNINPRYRNFNLEIDGGTAFWNGKNLRNQNVASGVYILMLSDLESYETKILKLMIIR